MTKLKKHKREERLARSKQAGASNMSFFSIDTKKDAAYRNRKVGLVDDSSGFISTSLVLTQRGFVPIASILVGDIVYTHKHRWRKVIATSCHEVTRSVEIDDSLGTIIECATGQQILARHNEYDGDTILIKKIGETVWTKASDFDDKTAWKISDAHNANLEVELPIGISCVTFWNLVGRWLGGGFIEHDPNVNDNAYYNAVLVLKDGLPQEFEDFCQINHISYTIQKWYKYSKDNVVSVMELTDKWLVTLLRDNFWYNIKLGNTHTR